MLSGNVAIITGGAAGIGKAAADSFLEQGADVVIADIDAELGEETADEIGCEFIQCDVSEYEAVTSVVEQTVNSFGQLDVLVNNAGIGAESRLHEMTLDEWRRVLSVNLDGVMHGAKAALPELLLTEGCIVNIESIYGLRGGKGAAAYSASKGGVVNLTQQLAVDYAEDNVRVNGVCPGFVNTPMTSGILEDDRFYEFIKTRTPMNRVADPEEIAPLITFLASDGASYITGANIPVDGGWTAF